MHGMAFVLTWLVLLHSLFASCQLSSRRYRCLVRWLVRMAQHRFSQMILLPVRFSQLVLAHLIASKVLVQAQHFYFVVASPGGGHMDGSGAFERSSRGWTRGLCHAEGRLSSEVQKLEGPYMVASCSLRSGSPYGLSYRIESKARGGFHKQYLAKMSQFSNVLATGLSYSFGHIPEHIVLK